MQTLTFKGCAHPKRPLNAHEADLSPAQMRHINLGSNAKGGPTPLLVEHNRGDKVGSVHASWQAEDGSMRVVGTVTDAAAASRVRRGELRGLSLGQTVERVRGCNPIRRVEEVSICEEGAREGTWITEIDGVPTREARLVKQTADGTNELRLHATIRV